MKPPYRKKNLTPISIILTAAGIVLFIYFVNRAGLNQIYDGIKRLGAGFLLIIVVSGLRHAVRSAAWCL